MTRRPKRLFLAFALSLTLVPAAASAGKDSAGRTLEAAVSRSDGRPVRPHTEDGWLPPTGGRHAAHTPTDSGWIPPTGGRHGVHSPRDNGWIPPSGRVAAAPTTQLAPTEDDFYDPSAMGPYGVGVMQLEVPARHLPEPLYTLIWYPATIPSGSTPYVYVDDPEFGGAIWGTAVENAPIVVDRDPYPAVVFSHGNGGLAYQSIFLTEHLASHGYVVISCNHPGNTWFDYNPATFITGLFTRPRDISALIDELERLDREPESQFAGTIDLDRIGMSGHSFGGYTTLAIGGAILDTSFRDGLCRQGDAYSCKVLEAERQLGLKRGMHDLSDKRVKAIAPLAPWAWEPFRAEGLSYLQIPLQVHGGGLDDTCPMEKQIEPVWMYAQEPKSMLEIYEAGHYTYSDICMAKPDWDECSEPFIDIDFAHMLINTWVTSHFEVFLEADSRYQSYLTPEYAQTWEAEVAWWEALNL